MTNKERLEDLEFKVEALADILKKNYSLG